MRLKSSRTARNVPTSTLSQAIWWWLTSLSLKTGGFRWLQLSGTQIKIVQRRFRCRITLLKCHNIVSEFRTHLYTILKDKIQSGSKRRKAIEVVIQKASCQLANCWPSRLPSSQEVKAEMESLAKPLEAQTEVEDIIKWPVNIRIERLVLRKDPKLVNITKRAKAGTEVECTFVPSH